MALARYGAIIADLRGTIASCTFSRSRAGATVRSSAHRSPPRSPSQTAYLPLLSHALHSWRYSLTQAQRDAWNAAAATAPAINSLGQSISLSGWQAYARAYVTLARDDVACPASPPDPLVLPRVPADMTWSAAIPSISYDNFAYARAPYTGRVLYASSRVHSYARTCPAPPLTTLYHVQFSKGAVINSNLLLPPHWRYSARAWYWFRGYTNSGQVSSPWVLRLDMTPP